LVEACANVDIVSGSRYLEVFAGDSQPPADRRRINWLITAELNQRLGLDLTDGFCGFKAYRVQALSRLNITEAGYAMPIELWVQAVAAELRIVEFPVPLIYLDESRSFGGELDDGETRLLHYHEVLERAIRATPLLSDDSVTPEVAQTTGQ
jgi:dolichol-phosphate mannosyltransferase